MSDYINGLLYKNETSVASNILEDISKSIIDNSSLIINANRDDIKLYKKQIRIKELLRIIEKYKNFGSIHNNLNERIIVYYGDPYLTLNLCIQAILSQTVVYLASNSFMNNVNNAIIQIINSVASKYSNNNLIFRINDDYNINSIIELSANNKLVEVIGDTSMYQLLSRNIFTTFYPYNNITLYCNSTKFEKLKQAIYVYSNENNYEIEIIYEPNIDKAINYINRNNLSNITVLLTENQEVEQKFRLFIKNKEVFINENPFKNENSVICNYFIKEE